MPNLVVKDNSLGEAFGLLGQSYSNMVNPKTQWEAYNLKQRVEHTQMLNQKLAQDAATEAARLEALKQAEEGVAQVAARSVAQMPAQIEQGRVDFNNQDNQNFQGPFQGVLPRVENPGILNADVLRRGQIAALRSGQDPAAVSRQSLGYGMVAGGLPTNEGQARLAQTFIGGSIPGAGTAYTEEQRRVMAREDEARKMREAINVPKEGAVLLTPEAGQARSIQPDENGQYWLRAPNTEPPPMFPTVYGGTSESAMDNNIVLGMEKLRQEGKTPTPDQQNAYLLAKRRMEAAQTTFGPGGLPRTIQPPPLDTTFGRNPNMTPRPLGAQPPLPQAAPAAGPPAAPTGGGAAGGGLRSEVQADGSTATFPDPQGHVTADTAKQGAFYARSMAGDRELRDLEANNRLSGQTIYSSTDPRGNFPVVGSLPLGLGEIASPVARSLLPNDAQLHRGAAERFITGVLRAESGAVIGRPEYASAEQMFVPTASDSPEVRKQKSIARQIAVETSKATLEAKSPQEMLALITERVNAAMAQGGAGGAVGAPQQTYQPRDNSATRRMLGMPPG